MASEFLLKIKTEARVLARPLGIIKTLSFLRDFVNKLLGYSGYEYRFDFAMRNAIRAGDVVWDVGANLGLYTVEFSDLVGKCGRVCAFEPVSSCFAVLKEKCSLKTNVSLYHLALGQKKERLPMKLASNPLGATHSLATSETSPNFVFFINF